MIPPLTVRPIVHTDHKHEWLRIFRALGASVLIDEHDWTEIELDRGRVAFHRLFDGVQEGDVALGFEAHDVDTYSAAIRPMDGMKVERITADHGKSIMVVGRDGLQFLIDQRVPSDIAANVTNWVQALWVTTDVPATAQDLETLGLQKWITERNGRTISLRAPEGDVLVHTNDGGPIGAGVAVNTTDLDACHKALIDAGATHDVIDETFGRTLKVPFPGAHEQMLWIAQADEDPVGALRHD
jgi:hypothetical protein